jgi:hypothetical protein
MMCEAVHLSSPRVKQRSDWAYQPTLLTEEGSKKAKATQPQSRLEAAIVKNIGRNCVFAGRTTAGAEALSCQSLAASGFVKKLSFFSKILLTMNVAPAYKPLTNEGGGAAGDRRTRSEIS